MLDWSTIVAEHGEAVWKTVFRILGRHSDAQDCYQETFLAAVRFSRKNRTNHWRRWLITVATRRAIDRLRQRVKSQARTQSLQSVGEESDLASANSDYAELLDLLRHGLTELPKKQGEAFWLSAVEGLSYEEIADMLQVDVNYTGVLLHRARTHLRQSLREHSPDRRVS